MSEHRTYGQWSFNAGELSPRMIARVDQNIYGNGAATMVGWLPLLQGPATAAPGTIYVETAAGPCRLFPFESIVTQGYVIEASAGKFRFYTNDARIDVAPGVPYEVAHDYTLDELLALDYWQSNDVLYLVGAGKQPKKLERTGATTFQLVDLVLTEGPIDTGNGDETITVTTNGTVVNILVTASAAIFKPTDVGAFLEIVAKDFNDVPSWEPGMTINAPTVRQWGGRVYQAQSSGRTGGNPPEHDEGIAWDGSDGTDINNKGPYGITWLYLYNAYGLVKIIAYTSPTEVTASVVKRLADSVITTPTWRWSFGAFSDTRGWPDTVGGWNDTLVLTKGNRVFVSVIDDFENFGRRDGAGDFQRDLSGGFTLPKSATIRWQASDRLLLIGTDTDEYTVERVQIQTGSAGPPVWDIRLQSSFGSSAGIKPIQSDGRILFVQRAGRKLREYGYAIQNDRYLAPDMTRLADHMGAQGFVDLAWQAEPERLAWAVRGDGQLAAMTYEPQQEVMGWVRRQLGGDMIAVSVARITDTDGKLDQLWIAASLDDATLILRMAPIWQLGDDPKQAIYSDAALSYDGAPVSYFSDLDHLEGKTVDILADGIPHRQLVVTGGAVELDYAAAQVHIGLPFPAVLTTLPPEVGQDEGTARGKIKRVLDLNIELAESAGIEISVQGCDAIPLETRLVEDPSDVAAPLFTGIKPILTIGTYETLGQVTVERVQPTPATLIAVVPTLEVGEH